MSPSVAVKVKSVSSHEGLPEGDGNKDWFCATFTVNVVPVVNVHPIKLVSTETFPPFERVEVLKVLSTDGGPWDKPFTKNS